MSLKQFCCNVVRQGWRPLSGWGIVGGIVVNTIVLPLHGGQGVDLVSFAALIGACAPLSAVRAWEKKHVEASS